MGKDQHISFHETFKLDRVRLAVIAQVAIQYGGSFTASQLEAETSLGKNMRVAFPRWGIRTGLLVARTGVDREGDLTARGVTQDYFLTTLGNQIATRDPQFVHPDTLWLLHLMLRTNYGPGPLFWTGLFDQHVRAGQTISRSDVSQQISALQYEAFGKSPSEESCKRAATIFLRTYADDECLGPLGLLSARGPDEFRVGLPRQFPSVWAFSYALSDYWARTAGDSSTLNLELLFASGGLAESLYLDRESVDGYLRTLKNEGVLDVFRVAPPYQVARHWDDHTEFQRDSLQRMFDDDST